MDDMEWMDEVMLRAKTDEWYQVWLREVKTLEPEFAAIRDALPEHRRERLDDYISACESLEGALTLLAYKLGREHGIRTMALHGEHN